MRQKTTTLTIRTVKLFLITILSFAILLGSIQPALAQSPQDQIFDDGSTPSTEEQLKSYHDDTGWFDPTAGCDPATTSANTPIIGGDNLEKSFNFFIGKGLTPMQSAAIVGNMMQESGPLLDPKVVNSIGATGIAQWLGGRKINLFDYGDNRPKDRSGKRVKNYLNKKVDPLTVETQLNFLWFEVTEGAEVVFKALDGLKSATDLEDAVTTWELRFERAGVAEANIPQRVTYAQQVLNKYGDGTATAGDTTAEQASDCKAISTDFADDGFIVYDQCDPAWGNHPYSSTTICPSGCGPAALAMVITNFTGERVTPVETADYAASRGMYIQGVGSSWAITPVLAERYGLNTEKIIGSISNINKVLNDGGMVVITGMGPPPFTSAGHFIVIRAVTENGKWKVGDSAHADANTKEWDPAFIMTYANTSSPYAVYGPTAAAFASNNSR